MSAPRLRTVLVGFGQIAHGLATDRKMAAYFPCATHAQALIRHPAFEWTAVLDRSPGARSRAREVLLAGVVTDSIEELRDRCDPEVAVLALPPNGRTELLEGLPSLRAVLVEKPLGSNLAEARAFLGLARERGILVQVNYWRRADESIRALASGGLEKKIGPLQSIFGVYGNGLSNNGTHLIDLVRLVAGEVESVQAVPGTPPLRESPLEGDTNPAFTLSLASGRPASIHPLRFARYREVGLVVWGEEGRYDILQESLVHFRYPVRPNRGLEGEREVASDAPETSPGAVGLALPRMYDNLAGALAGRESLWSPGENALVTEAVAEAVRESIRRASCPVHPGEVTAR